MGVLTTLLNDAKYVKICDEEEDFLDKIKTCLPPETAFMITQSYEQAKSDYWGNVTKIGTFIGEIEYAMKLHKPIFEAELERLKPKEVPKIEIKEEPKTKSLIERLLCLEYLSQIFGKKEKDEPNLVYSK